MAMLLVKLRDLLQVANRERLVDIARHEAGAATGAIYAVHVDGSLRGMDTLLDIFPTVRWEEDRGRAQGYELQSDRTVVYEAVGVVGAITPWNVPLYVNVAKVVSALLAGCTVILKPAPNTPVAGAILGELAAEAGFRLASSMW